MNKQQEKKIQEFRIKITQSQISSEFMELFSRYVINTQQFNPMKHYPQGKVNYQNFYQTLKIVNSKWRQTRKNNSYPPQAEYQYIFETTNNHIILLLDCSPYMLVYDYSTKSIPLKSMEETIVLLIRKLQQIKSQNLENKYALTIYLFSVYSLEVQKIIKKQEIKDVQYLDLVNYIVQVVRRSPFLHSKPSDKIAISNIIQKIAEDLQLEPGLKCLITVSLFFEEQSKPSLFFGTDWLIYAFICTGQSNLGSVIIDQDQINQCFTTSKYFATKFIFKVQFLENWQVKQLIKKKAISESHLQRYRNRCIVFHFNQSYYQNIFHFLLSYKLKRQNYNLTKSKASIASESKKRVQTRRQYLIEQENFNTIIKIRSQQGWQLLNPHLVDSTKFVFRLTLNGYRSLIYDAQRERGHFKIKISECVSRESGSIEFNDNDLNFLQKIDKINSSNFQITIENWNSSKKLGRLNESGFNFLQNSQDQNQQLNILNFIGSNPNNWPKFFKVRRIYLKFEPRLSQNLFNEFITEINFFLGQRITQLFFLKKTQIPVPTQNPLYKNKTVLKSQFTKFCAYGSIVQMQFGFLKYSHIQLKQSLKNLCSKLNLKKFKLGKIYIVPEQLYIYTMKRQLSTFYPFRDKFQVKFYNEQFYRIYLSYLPKLIQRNYFINIRENSNQNIHNYYRIIKINQQHQNQQGYQKVSKTLFLKIIQKHHQLKIIIEMMTLPSFSKIFIKKRQEETQIIQIENKNSFSHLPLCKATSLSQASNSYFDFSSLSSQSLAYKNDPLYYSISYNQLFFRYCESIKQQQQKIIKMLQFYQYIHIKILKEKDYQKMANINGKLKQRLKQMYGYGSNFVNQHQKFCQKIYQQYYCLKQNVDVSLEDIPAPKNKLIQASIEDIKDQITIQENNKKYIFFMYSPFTIIYIQKQKNTNLFFYKTINIMYQNTAPQQQEQVFKQLMLQQICHIIKRQEYLKKYSTFFIKRTTKCILQNPMSFSIDITPIFTYKYQELIKDRIIQVLNKFQQAINKLINCLFVNANSYYFQKEKLDNLPNSIEDTKSKLESFNQIILKRILKINNQEILITETNKNFISLIKKKSQNDKIFLIYQYYSNWLDEYQNQKMNYLRQIFIKISQQCLLELQRVSIFRVQKLNILIRMKKLFNFVYRLKFSSLINKDQSPQRICQAIQTSHLQEIMKFRRINNHSLIFTLCQENQTFISVPTWIYLQMTDNQIECSQIPIKYMRQSINLQEKIKKYFQVLTDYMNVSFLINHLLETQQLPSQLFVNQYVSKAIKLSKNELKVPETSRKLKKIGAKRKFDKNKNSNQNFQIDSKSYQLNQLYRSAIPLHQRFRENMSLKAIKFYPSFRLNSVTNQYNTYAFPKFIANQNLIFNFQEMDIKQGRKILSQIPKQLENEKVQKVLIYFVYCLNPLIKKQDVQKLIRLHISQALNNQLFQIISDQLFKNPSLIVQSDQIYLKAGTSKIFEFEVPFIEYKPNYRSYLKQYILAYHDKTVFKSDSKRIEQTNCESNPNGKYEGKGCIEHMWLFNFRKSEKFGDFGRCLYILKIEIIDSVDNNQNSASTVIWAKSDKRKYIYPKDSSGKRRKAIKQYLTLSKNSSKDFYKNNRKQKLTTHVKFHLSCIQGSPNLTVIQNAFQQVIYYGLTDYYIENQLYFLRTQIIDPMLEKQIQTQDSTVLESNKSQHKSIIKSQSKQNQEIIYRFIECIETIENILEKSDSLAFLIFYSKYKMYLKDLQTYFKDFIRLFDQLFQKNNQKQQIAIIIYGEYKNGKKVYYLIKNLKDINIKFHQFIKIGLLYSDNILENFSISNKNDIDLLKYFQEDLSYCQYEYYFKRSVILKYQVSSTKIYLFTYNLQLKINKQFKDYLTNLQIWLRQKQKLLVFIQKIKDKNCYDKPIIQGHRESKQGFLNSFHYLPHNHKNQRENQRWKNSTQLLKHLIKDKFPKYLVHNNELNQLYDLLMLNRIFDYGDYSEYKEQKDYFEKIGWEYMSILRNQFRIRLENISK